MEAHDFKRILKPTEKTAYYFTLDTSPYDLHKDIKCSKIGGIPYWPVGLEYPKFENENFKLVAQLNLDELSQKVDLKKISPYYPTSGILQFFYPESGSWWDDDYFIFYHKTSDAEHSLTDEQISTAFNDEHMGFDEGFKITLNVQTKELLGSKDLLYQRLFSRDIPEINDNAFNEILMWGFDDVSQNTYEQITGGTKIGGYASFAQEDPLCYADDEFYEALNQYFDEDNNKYPMILLFQMDSDLNNMCWGDAGVANWRIDVESLRDLEFQNTIFNYDCG